MMTHINHTFSSLWIRCPQGCPHLSTLGEVTKPSDQGPWLADRGTIGDSSWQPVAARSLCYLMHRALGRCRQALRPRSSSSWLPCLCSQHGLYVLNSEPNKPFLNKVVLDRYFNHIMRNVTHFSFLYCKFLEERKILN